MWGRLAICPPKFQYPAGPAGSPGMKSSGATNHASNFTA
jgi:hypothetical protein